MNPNDSIEQARGQDLSAALVERETRAKKTWFIERLGDGKIFACEEMEANEIINNRGNWMRRDFRIVGVSDGTTYKRVVAESRAKADKVASELAALENERVRYAKAEERMIFDDVIDPEDTSPENAENLAKLKRIRDVLKKYDVRIEEKRTEFKKHTADVTQNAFEAELAVARGHIERPAPGQNIITPGASPELRAKILRTMNEA